MAQQEVEHHVSERIVHRRIELVAKQVMARIAVADLVGGILPDLADKHPIGLFLKEHAADIRDERLLQLVGHIEAPARAPARVQRRMTPFSPRRRLRTASESWFSAGMLPMPHQLA